jgi:hypothetical protein
MEDYFRQTSRKTIPAKNGAEHESRGTHNYNNDLCPSLVAIPYGNVSCSNNSLRYCTTGENACLVSKNLHQPVSVIIALRPEENALQYFTT